jgi:hypothetical protein
MSTGIDEFKNAVSKEPFSYFSYDFFKENFDKKSYVNILYPNFTHLHGYCGIVLEKNYSDKDKFDSICRKLEKDNIFKSNFSDSTKYIMLEKNKKIGEKTFPLPNLNDFLEKIGTDLNFEKSIILGLKKEYGNYLNSEFLKDKNNEKLNSYLDKTKNGFSNGAIVDFSSNKIIYWVIIW